MNTHTQTTAAPVRVPAISGHVYAFRLYAFGWFNAGLVDNTPDRREWWAHYWKTTINDSGDGARGQRAQAVAFLPYCVQDSNFVSQAQVDADAVAIL